VQAALLSAVMAAETAASLAGGGENGITDFNRLHSRTHDALAYAYAFDLLAINGKDTRALPLSGKTKAWVKLKDFEIVHIYAGIMRPYERSLRVVHTSRVAACPEWKR
jgi:hypothetical protein